MTLKLTATGSYLPEKILSNDDLSKVVDTTDQWIVERTGIKQRHISSNLETCAFMASAAANRALASCKLDAGQIDLIIVASTTADSTFPSIACLVQANLGCRNIPAFDLQAVCAGFIYTLSVASAMQLAGGYKNILLIGVERMSLIVDWQDRNTCILFGDGAGAAIFSSDINQNFDEPKLIDSIIYADGSLAGILKTTGGLGYANNHNAILMQGSEVFKHGVQKMSAVALEILQKNDLSIDDIAYLVPHQANIRMIDAIAQKLQIDDAKIIKTIQKHANCSAASIPLALDHLMSSNAPPKSGDLILTVGLGGGLAWGASLVRC